jgi:hypothetical protein
MFAVEAERMPRGESRGVGRVMGERRRWGMMVREGRVNGWRRVPTRLSSRCLDIDIVVPRSREAVMGGGGRRE